MFYTLLYLTALLSQLQVASGASTLVRPTQGRGSIAALNNLVVIGDGIGDNTGAAAGDGAVSFAFYTYAIGTNAGEVAVDDYTESRATVSGDGGSLTNTMIEAQSTDLAGNDFKGLGHQVAIGDMNTVFVSQTSYASQTGRVVVYEGNVTQFTQSQLLIPHDGKQRLDSSAAFGESIAAKPDALAVGCQNCNSSAPMYSGAVYVYKPNKEGRWSESQVLTADGVLFLGERVAMHDKVLVAAGDDSTTFSKASMHNLDREANTVVVFEEKGSKFEQRQVIAPKAASKREEITGVTVFDETIAITTKGSDVGDFDGGTATFTQRDKVYIYYPMNKRYGLEPKGKPSPQQWTNVQILSVSNVADVRYLGGEPMTSISMNQLQYLTSDDSANSIAIASSRRDCLSCMFTTPTVAAFSTISAQAVTKALLTSDSTAFYSYGSDAATAVSSPVPNNFETKCLTLELQDQYNDGWGIASLSVTSPSGREDKFTLTCQSANPNIFKYCPQVQEEGRYHLHIDKGQETPFGWEIMWKVAADGTWYYGDRDTHMDFLWDAKYGDFQTGATEGLLPLVDTCEVCSSTKPEGKRRSLSNLRSLHHKGKTSSPTISQAPTIVATGFGALDWHLFSIETGSTAWFNSNYNGANFYISDPKGKKLISTGRSCSSAAIVNCYQDLHDGDYVVRVGQGVQDVTSTPYSKWTFCGASKVQSLDHGFQFSVVDDACYVGAEFSVASTCLHTAAVQPYFYLSVDLVLSGASASLTASDESTVAAAVSETMMSVVGMVPSSATVSKQAVQSGGVALTMLVEFTASPDLTALDNLVRDSSSAGSLLKYELIGTQSMAAHLMNGQVSGVSITAIHTDVEVKDFSKVDESSFETVSDHVWMTASTEQSSNDFNVYAKYVAEGAYALVAVAAVLAVSLFIKRAVTKTPVAQEEETLA